MAELNSFDPIHRRLEFWENVETYWEYYRGHMIDLRDPDNVLTLIERKAELTRRLSIDGGLASIEIDLVGLSDAVKYRLSYSGVILLVVEFVTCHSKYIDSHDMTYDKFRKRLPILDD